MRKTFVLIGLSLFTLAQAQETEQKRIEDIEQRTENIEGILGRLEKLKISGYLQGQFQWGEEAASLKVGSGNENPDKSFSRIGIRRGRIKFAYEEGIATGVFQLDITENGVGLKDVYLNIKDPWTRTNALRAGVFDRPFGFEIGHSSSRRETPERSTVFQTLFPDERDLGAMLILQPAQTSPWHVLKLEAGLFAGNGIRRETDSRKDFIGHLSFHKMWHNAVVLGLGISHYNGFVYQGTDAVYKMDGEEFVYDSSPSNLGKYAKRIYTGLDAQFSLKSSWGMTQLRAEYLFGQQPGTESGSKSPNYSSLPDDDTYIRDFSGGYVILVQDIGVSPFAAVVKYDWYDPNTKVSGDEIGYGGTTQADLSRHTIGLGALWHINNNLRLQAYYEFNRNEKSEYEDGWSDNLKDDVFTLRLQYRF